MVDTEEEFDWSRPFARDRHATTAARAIPVAHARFAAAGVPLTYLTSYPIATDPAAIAAIAPLLADGSTVGAQLHSWVTPPFVEELTTANSFAGNLPEAVEAAKLDALTDAIARGFGQRPIVYRAGRYGLGPNTAALLGGRGYRFDSSIRPGHDYSPEGGPDFSGNDNLPRALAPGLVGLPVSTVFTGGLRRGGGQLHQALGRVPKARGLFARAGLLSRVALTPEGMPIPEARRAVATAISDGVPLLTFSFHSPSLVPGHTPYVRDARDLATFWAWWDAMLAWLAAQGVAPIGIDALAEALGGGGAIR